MNTKEKYTEIIKEVVRNEAVSKDKLVALAKKYKANKLKIQFYLRKAGVIEGLGDGVNRVLIRDQEITPYVDKVLELTKGGYKKKTDKGLPGNWRNTKHELFDIPDMEAAEDDDPNTHARAETTNLQHANYESIKRQEERITGIENRITELENRMNRQLAELDNRLNNIEADYTKADRNLNLNIKII